MLATIHTCGPNVVRGFSLGGLGTPHTKPDLDRNASVKSILVYTWMVRLDQAVLMARWLMEYEQYAPGWMRCGRRGGRTDLI